MAVGTVSWEGSVLCLGQGRYFCLHFITTKHPLKLAICKTHVCMVYPLDPRLLTLPFALD